MRDVCSIVLNLFRQIVVYLTLVLPKLAEQAGDLLNAPITHWDDAQTPLTGTPVSEFKHMGCNESRKNRWMPWLKKAAGRCRRRS